LKDLPPAEHLAETFLAFPNEKKLQFHTAGFFRLLERNNSFRRDGTTISEIYPEYAKALRTANSANPSKHPLLEAELVLQEMFYEKNIPSLAIAVENLKKYNLQEANHLRNRFGNLLITHYSEDGNMEAAVNVRARLGLPERTTLIPLAVSHYKDAVFNRENDFFCKANFISF